MESQVEVLANPPFVQLIVPNQGDPLNQGIPSTIVMEPNQPPAAVKVQVTGVENPPVESETDKMLLEVYNLRESIPKSPPKDAARKTGVAKRNIATRPGMVTGKKGKSLVKGSTLNDQNDGSDVADDSNDESGSEQTGTRIKRPNNLSYQPDILATCHPLYGVAPGLRGESEPPEANPTPSTSSVSAKKKPKAMREPPKEKSAPQKKMSTDVDFFSTMNTLMDDMREATKVQENIAAEERKQLVLDREAKDRRFRKMQQTREREMEAAKKKKLDKELDLQKHKSTLETMLRSMANRAP